MVLSKEKRKKLADELFNEDALTPKEQKAHHKEADRLEAFLASPPNPDRPTERTNYREEMKRQEEAYNGQPEPKQIISQEEIQSMVDVIMQRHKRISQAENETHLLGASEEQENPDLDEDRANQEAENKNEEEVVEQDG